MPYFEHWGLLLTDEHTDVWVTQVSAVDLFVAASRIDVCKGLIDLQGPDPFIVHPVGGDTPLLAERPQADGPVWTARQALWRRSAALDFKIPVQQLPPLYILDMLTHLSAISIQQQRLDVVCVTF